MTKKIILAAFVSILFVGCISTKNINYENLTQKYVSTISESALRTNLTIIASDEMEGRQTGSEGQKKAGRYIIEQYKNAGVSFPKGAKNYYQNVPAAFLNAKYNGNLSDSENIWAYIEGTDLKDEVVVLSAHYDHIGIEDGEIFNGADDDGSGTVALIEIAKAFQKAKNEGNGPRRSVLILHVTGEEHGLHGSRYYTENPLFSLKNTVANVNIDMIGRSDDRHIGDNNYVYVIGSDYLSTDLYNVCENANKKHIGIKLDYTYNDKKDKNRYYYRSDHYNFAKNGIPSVFFFNGVHADYHKASDEVDKIEFDALTKRTKYAFAVTWEIATMDKRLVVDKNDAE